MSQAFTVLNGPSGTSVRCQLAEHVAGAILRNKYVLRGAGARICRLMGLTMRYKATIEYRDAYTHGRWKKHICIRADRYFAARMALEHCSDCEYRNLRVEEVA